LPRRYTEYDGDSTGRIADIGCGSGVLTVEIAETYPKASVIGIDYAPDAFRVARQRLAPYENTTIIGGDARNILDEVRPFAFIFAINMVQDTSEPVRTINALANNLTDDGTLAMTVPNKQAIEIFSEFSHYDEELDLPYMKMDDIRVGGEGATWKQYVFPEERVQEIVDQCGLELVETGELAADATGLLYPMKLLNDDERLAWAESLVKQQEEDPKAGPTVPLYILSRRSE